MDSFAQVAAYLQPTLEYAAKLGSIIPLWMLLIMADKHLLGLPIFGGSLWHSPRIRPHFTIKGGHGGGHTPTSKSGRHSAGNGSGTTHDGTASFGSSPVESDSKDFATPYAQPSQAPLSTSNSLPVWASGTAALSVYQPLEVHDPFNPSSPWLEPGYVASAVFLFLIFAFVHCRWYLFGKSQASQSRRPIDIEAFDSDPLLREQLTGKTEFQICWESILEELVLPNIPINEPMPPTQTLSLSTVTSVQIQPSAPVPLLQMLSLSAVKSTQTPPSLPTPPPPPSTPTLSLSAIVSVSTAPSTPVSTSPILGLAMINSAYQTPSAPVPTPPPTTHHSPAENIQGSHEESSTVEEIIESVIGCVAASEKRGDRDHCRKEPEKGNKDQNGTKTNAAVADKKRENGKNGTNKDRIEAGEEDDKDDQEKEGELKIDEDLMSESRRVLEHDSLDEGLTLDGKKKKKKVRQNAKKRIARRAAAEEASKEVGEARNTFREDTEECKEHENKAEEVGEASEAFHDDEKTREDKQGKENEKEGKGPGASHEDTKEREDEKADRENDTNNAPELEARDPPEADPSRPPEPKKRKRRRRGGKHEVKDHVATGIDYEPDDLAEDCEHGNFPS